MLTPYDWQENIQNRAQYILNRLREGSPVIGISYDEGVMLFSLRRKGRKIYEIYDRLIFSAIGNQADIETLRTAAIDFAHQEGFVRSPDDVTIQRVVGFALSPALKKAFGDPLAAPFVVKALFAELNLTPEKDLFYVLNYDGEFTPFERFAVIAGTTEAESTAIEQLGKMLGSNVTFERALPAALIAWGIARAMAHQEEGEDQLGEEVARTCLKTELQEAEPEVGLLQRVTRRETRFYQVPYATLEKYIQHL